MRTARRAFAVHQFTGAVLRGGNSNVHHRAPSFEKAQPLLGEIDLDSLIRGAHGLHILSYQLSAISYQLSAISYQLSAISYQQSY
jgi:hypothetical protein